MYKPRECNAKRQRCCGAPLCRLQLKSELQKKYLEEGYWRSDCIRFKRCRYRSKRRFLSRNPDIFVIFHGLKGGLSRVLDCALNLGGDMLEYVVNELETHFDDMLCGAL
jgi:hypothetical protein